jgi:DNA-directed RNA polymerase subunit beta'
VDDIILSFFEKPKSPDDIEAVRISLASPEQIRSWSYGEVKKPETINYRTFKPERDGLFCARIFGPIKDYECLCGKYKRMKHRGIVCEKCGVEVIPSKVRRERMGHIELAAPVAHPWFLRSVPSKIGMVLDMTLKELEKVLYFEAFVVIDPKDSPYKEKELISEEEYQEYIAKYGKDSLVAGTGAEALRELLKRINLEELSEKLRFEMKETQSEARKLKIAKRLKIIEAFRDSGNRPEYMILEVIPVIPPDLRPLVPLDGGRFATSDLNDLYRRVINRNNRLKRLIELNAPEIIIRNEKRMLQEAVDALFDNGRRGRRAIIGAHGKPLRSLGDMLRGKQGRFRQNLLGKRVDYSGRSVIVVGPELRLHQCGLPKKMALELFKPFIYNKLEERGYATTIKSAKKMVEKERPEVWDILEEVIREHPVLLNRAPTLHRLGIQAFEPLLTEHKAIQLHPLVCVAYNADFDGDQMAVHVPLSIEAQTEARVLMMSTNNILSPAHGKPIILPTQDIVLGLYYMSRERPYAKGEGKAFSSLEEVKMAYLLGEVELHARIKVKLDGKVVDTTVGRVLLKEILPEEIPFELVNRVMDKKAITNLIDYTYRVAGEKKTVILADRLKDMGFAFATLSGISMAIKDVLIPSKKAELVEKGMREAEEVRRQYLEGIITDGERYNRTIDIWAQVTEEIASEMMKELAYEKVKTPDGREELVPSFNPVFIMADSGARGSPQQIRQLAGVRGLMAKPSGEIIETPITSNLREGMSVLQYFISTHGARKGLADTALKTANAGYLTRRLVDVAQDVRVTEHDCGTIDGIAVSALVEGGEILEPLTDRILGRVALEDIIDPYTGEVIVKANEEIDEEKAQRIADCGITEVKIRSVLTCESRDGVCALCYGRDLARGKLVDIGEAVGIIAAQSIGEPGTQLTMRTFHIGGAASRQVEESKLEAPMWGRIKFINLKTVRNREGKLVVMNRKGEVAILDQEGRERKRYPLPYGAKLLVEDGQEVREGELIAEWDPYTIPIITEFSGWVKFGDIIEGVTVQELVDEVTGHTRKVIIECKDPDLRPRISIKQKRIDEEGKEVLETIGRYYLAVGSTIFVKEGSWVEAGDVLAKIPRQIAKTKDITGGLPRVAELFEARRPKEQALISEIEGYVSFGKIAKGRRKIIITPEVGEPKEYLIPKGKHVTVQEGEYVRAGEPLMDGTPNPHDILRVLGEKALARFLVDEIKVIYLLQGVKIHDKHFEVIVRQMLKRVRVKDPGDTRFVYDEVVDKFVFREENERVIREGKRPAVAEPVVMGITKAALYTDSWISAASFQETVRVLTQAAIEGRTDYLRGIKENVIIGRLIPAGTGYPLYRDLDIKVVEEELIPIYPSAKDSE